MNSKRGVLGGITMMFVATIAIVLILFIFAFSADMLRRFSGNEERVTIMARDEIGLGDIFNYMDGYVELVESRVSVVREKFGGENG